MVKLPTPRFNLRSPNSDSATLIFLVYRYRGKKVLYSTGLNAHPNDWDFNTQRPIDKVKRPDLWMLRRRLDDIAAYCKNIFIEANYGYIDVPNFKKQLDEKIGKLVFEKPQEESNSNEPPKPSLLEFLDLELEDMKIQGMRESSWDAFDRHVKVIKKFAKEIRTFDYEDVDWDLRSELVDWLASRNIKLAYGNKTLSILRQFMERARRKKLHANIDYQGTGWVIPQKKAVGQKVTLSGDELQTLAELKLFGIAEIVRDLFLIGAGTGQRFSDYSRYTPNNFYKTVNGIPILSLISQKTDTPAKVPLNLFPWLVPILEKYNYASPKVSMQKFNVHIKDICHKAKFEDQVFIVEQYIGRKARVKKKYIPKFKQVSSHTCRRSFATNLYRMGYRLSQIMPMTGHATESQLREYIGIDGEENAEAIALQIMNQKISISASQSPSSARPNF